MDIKPPPKKRPLQVPVRETPPVTSQVPPPSDVTTDSRRKRISRRQLWAIILTCIGLLLLITSALAVSWYTWAIAPRSAETNQVRIVVESGDTASSIAATLYEHNLIRSRAAFSLYTQLTGTRNKLQAGGYVLSPNQNVSSIVDHMVSGKTDEFDVTILPGLTLDELRVQFKSDGFSDQEITEAFSATYDHPLLATRPAGSTLEGYIFPETYRMNADQTLEALLKRAFDQLYKALQDKKYLDEFAKQNLTIHQALTMASIIQKEVANVTDQQQVSQVFHKRLAEGIALQSDPTFIYAARKAGVEPRIDYDSPYNTYKYAGLPPGPIANFNFSALEAVVSPAAGDFLYFVADQYGITHFSKTIEEHEAKVQQFCTDHCNDF